MKRNNLMRLFLAVIFILAVSSVIFAEEAPKYEANITQPTLNGTLKGFEKDGVLHWFGVSYAQPPVGSLRWKAPAPVEKWDGIKDATESLAATQSAYGNENGALTLDIYRPANDKTNLPVFFYIHGGNNQTGRSSALPATAFTKDVDSVVISINHRLGLLGFCALPALKNGTPEENSGNFAMLDFAAALDWVKENISSFGGNPNNITISGSSSGGRDVMAMLISPIFKGKFQKAISFSGGMTTSDPEMAAKVDAKHLAPLAVSKGVKANEDEAYTWLLTDGDDVREFLYSLSDKELADAFGGAAIRMAAFPHHYTDGVVLPKEGYDSKYYNDVPVLMVNGDREFSLFCKTSEPFSKLTNAELFKDEKLFPLYKFTEKYGSLMYGYFNGEESAVKMLPDYKSPIYTCLIRWGDNPEITSPEYAAIVGAYHCITTPLMTGITASFSVGYEEIYARQSRKNVSALLNAYYRNFFYNDDPNGENLPRWEKWTKDGATTQLIVDADDEKATGVMSEEHTSYEKILDAMDADKSISDEDKAAMIRTVLNGRWFSTAVDERYGNPSLWVK
ncbi:MAG: carboxylesterase family protein [Synergistaceae bacterium]|nr:carboxylesterase family protein [Synergistaceae bacterium]MBR0279035.1 carboxylesterase family protein [Synergistaceae bacterium]